MASTRTPLPEPGVPGGNAAPGFGPGSLKPGRPSRFGPKEKPRDTRATVRRLLGLTRGHRGGLAAALVFSCAAAAVPSLGPVLIGMVVDALDTGGPLQGVLLLLVALYLGEWFVGTAQSLLLNRVGQHIVRDVRTALFGAMERLPLAFFDRHQHGELMSRVANDVDNVSTTLSTSLSELMVTVLTIAGMFAVMVSLNVPLTALTLVAVAVIFVLTNLITKRTRPLFKAQQANLGALNAQIEESVGGLTLVKAFGREEAVLGEFNELSERYRDTATKALVWSGFLMPMTGVVGNVAYVLVAVGGALMAAQGTFGADLGMVASFLLYVRQFIRPFTKVASIYNTLQTAMAGAERVFEVMDEKPEPADAPGALELADPRGHIELRDVWFGYDPAHPVLKGVSLNIPAGTRVAVVGATGSGKTTLINLLTRFYDVDAGSIELDGHDLRDYRRADLRAAYGVVLQDSALMTSTVAENIAYGGAAGEGLDPQELRAAVRRAAQAVGAHGFIERLPQGYDTLLEGGGAQLSQGERQLVNVARAVMANAPILILDEATSSVDTVTEQSIRRAVLELSQGRTSVVIAHRLGTVRDSDLIVVMEDGRIAEQGTHEELLDLGGIYAGMWRTQTAA